MRGGWEGAIRLLRKTDQETDPPLIPADDHFCAKDATLSEDESSLTHSSILVEWQHQIHPSFGSAVTFGGPSRILAQSTA